ncbi:hypothetical protein GCM10010377_41630 [Streptomyces viridiviolaceus]|nr:hypothetical protein GCM10010377_41630 [Streptomyces viridiviolaceus]
MMPVPEYALAGGRRCERVGGLGEVGRTGRRRREEPRGDGLGMDGSSGEPASGGGSGCAQGVRGRILAVSPA